MFYIFKKEDPVCVCVFLCACVCVRVVLSAGKEFDSPDIWLHIEQRLH